MFWECIIQRCFYTRFFFLNGKTFCLRGGEEHRNLKLSQVKRHTDPDRYVYTENSSKNRAGGVSWTRAKWQTVDSCLELVGSLQESGFTY